MCASLFTKSLNIIMLSSVQIVRYVRSANADSERCVVCTVSSFYRGASACNACRERNCFTNSVRPSVWRPMPVLRLN